MDEDDAKDGRTETKVIGNRQIDRQIDSQINRQTYRLTN